MLETNDNQYNINNNIEEGEVIKKVIMAKGKKKNDNKWKGKAIRDTEGLKAYNRSMGKDIGIRREEFDEIVNQCQRREGTYPPEGLDALFKSVIEGLEVRESNSAAWCGKKKKPTERKKQLKNSKNISDRINVQHAKKDQKYDR